MADDAALNAICPYYTMFPLSFPLRLLRSHARAGQWVADPFCGRGTTNFAARLCGLPTIGLDSSVIAVALSKAKLCSSSPVEVLELIADILTNAPEPKQVPTGEFWQLAYNAGTLRDICRLREALLADCQSNARILLRAILLGALHGPVTKQRPSHLSNQSPRTFAPKPAYAVRYWTERRLLPPKVDVREVVRERASRYLNALPAKVDGIVRLGDSRSSAVLSSRPLSWVISSPPYYGMRTYIPDQWIRNWFLGGTDQVDYRPARNEMGHESPDNFVANLAKVWQNVASGCKQGARLVARFGALNDRKHDPRELMRASLTQSGWRLNTARSAGTANSGRRQAIQFRLNDSNPITEYDFYACLG